MNRRLSAEKAREDLKKRESELKDALDTMRAQVCSFQCVVAVLEGKRLRLSMCAYAFVSVLGFSILVCRTVRSDAAWNGGRLMFISINIQISSRKFLGLLIFVCMNI